MSFTTVRTLDGGRRRWRYRYDVLAHLARREFIERYRNSTLGVLWVVSLPLAQLVVLVFLFQRVVPLGIDAYPAFVFTALLPWTWFTSSVGAASTLFIANRDLVRHPGFSPAVLVGVNALFNLLLLVLSLPVLLVLLAASGVAPTASLLALPVLVLIQGALITGIGLGVATLNVFYRDVQHLVAVALMLSFYLTPVFYDAAGAGERLSWVFRANPMAILVDAYRDVLLRGAFPQWPVVAVAATTSVVALAIGSFAYRARRHDIVDEV
jgi:ABC-type polysaccharide/polyol phosphate export permease